MRVRYIIALLALTLSLQAWSFGRVGHAGVAAIARANLTPTARETIEHYLGGDSIVQIASWMDHVRRTPQYGHTSGWHSAAIDSDGNISMWHKTKYHARLGIDSTLAKVSGGAYLQLPDSAVAVSIKLLVHLIGDIHCPSHSSFQGKSQGFTFVIDGKTYHFHKFFDGGIFTLARDWNPDEFVQHLDTLTAEQKQDIIAGSPTDWMAENAAVMYPLYDILTPGRTFDGDEAQSIINSMAALTDLQVATAGYRLAHLLNTLFDPTYTAIYP